MLRQALYMFGGQFSYDKSTLGVEQSVAFCPSIPSMIDLPLSSGPARSTAAAAALKRSIYILGGAVDTEWVRTVIRLDLDTLEWHDVIPPYAVFRIIGLERKGCFYVEVPPGNLCCEKWH